MAASGRPPTSSKLAASQSALTSYLRRQQDQAPPISQKRALSAAPSSSASSSSSSPVPVKVTKEKSKSSNNNILSGHNKGLASKITNASTTSGNVTVSLDKKSDDNVLSSEQLQERLSEYEQAGWITEQDYRVYNKLLKESQNTPDAALYREQVANDLHAAISKNAIIVQPTYVLHSPNVVGTAAANKMPEKSNFSVRSHSRRSSTSDVRTRIVTTENNKQQEVIVLEDIDDCASQRTEDNRRRSTGDAQHRQSHANGKQYKYPIVANTTVDSKLPSILMRNSSHSENRSANQHHVTWSDSPQSGSNQTSTGNSWKAPVRVWNENSKAQHCHTISEKDCDKQQPNRENLNLSSNAKTPLRSNIKSDVSKNVNSSVQNSFAGQNKTERNRVANHSSNAIVLGQQSKAQHVAILELLDIQEYQRQGRVSPNHHEMFQWFSEVKNIQQLFVEMCFFARLGFVQPPSCLQCTYKESLTEKHLRMTSSSSIAEIKVCPNLNCNRWVVWRKDASTGSTTSSASEFEMTENLDSPRSTCTMLRPDTIEGNILFVRCHAVRSLLEGKMVEARVWDKATKRLIVKYGADMNNYTSDTSIGSSGNRTWYNGSSVSSR